ncbi:major facilitator family transporter [Pseudescherichia vulneris]|nr:major facilitator family transporter [Pseudescherichia vulneris]
MITWGIVSAGMSLVQTPTQLYVMRFLLGMAEAGFTPGIIYYISCWFPKSNRARAMSFFYMGSVMASIIGLPISGSILNMHGIADIAGWRWLFALEGIPAIALGIMVLWRLPQTPDHAAWLTPEQKGWLKAQLERDNAGGRGRDKPQLDERVEKQDRAAAESGLVPASLWLYWHYPVPAADHQKYGQRPEQYRYQPALCRTFIAACLFMYFNGRHSDTTNERSLHLGLPLIISGLSLAIAIYSSNLLVAYFLLILTVGFNFALTPIFWAVTTEKLAGVAAAASIAFINTVANFVGLGLPPLLGKIKDATNSYHYGLLIVAVALILGGIIGILVSRPTQPKAAKRTATRLS